MKITGMVVVGAVVAAILGAAGCSSHSTPAAKDSAPAPTKPAESATGPAATDMASAQAIADKIKGAGITVGTLVKDSSGNYVSGVGGQSYDLTISEKAGQHIGDSGINLFPNDKALAVWVGLSQGFGGIAVTGDTWAVSLPSEAGDRAITERMAPKIAKAVGGTVVQ